MPVYHMVLFRCKPGVTPEQLESWKQTCQDMVGQIPGLKSVKCGPPLPISIPRAQGFDVGHVAVLEKSAHLLTYVTPSTHRGPQDAREAMRRDIGI